jgi:hypothetical protein
VAFETRLYSTQDWCFYPQFIFSERSPGKYFAGFSGNLFAQEAGNFRFSSFVFVRPLKPFFSILL